MPTSPARRRAVGRLDRAASVRVFAALGDPTRLGVVVRLCREGPSSIARLTQGSDVTRQAIRKHLAVLERTGLVRGRQQGRESLWELEPRRLEIARRHLDLVSRRWDDTLERLRAIVERESPAPSTSGRPAGSG
jgi:DNA-binding transcriptional ArsR family regulator